MNFKCFKIAIIVLIGSLSCQKVEVKSPTNQETINKVKIAMFSMQRRSWEQGTAMQGLMAVGDTLAVVNMAHEAAVIWRSKDGRLALCGSHWAISDPASNGPGVLFAFEVTGDTLYRNAAKAQYEYFKRSETRTPGGYIRHQNRKVTIVTDNSFMEIPFLAMMGDCDDAMHQLQGLRDFLWDPEVKLFHHGYSWDLNAIIDSSYWGGGNGWTAAAMAQLYEILPDERKADKATVKKYTEELLDGCLNYMLPSGLFYDKITEPNFEETNLGCMLAYTIYIKVLAMAGLIQNTK
jgi:rhamnogalacturonyl hydrolase YesR